MKLITRDTDYAVRALCYMAKRRNKIITVKELVKSIKIPRPFLRKLLQKLNKGKIVNSIKGKGGGFKMGRTAGDIFLTDIMRIFQGPVRLSEHVFKKKPCPRIKTCVLKEKLDDIEKKVINELETIAIASLIKK